MTMPNERTRALRWGAEVLQEICDDVLVCQNHRERAAQLLSNYPTSAKVLEWIQSDVHCIPVEAAIPIEGTADLLNQVSRSQACSAELKRSLTYTLRHFPEHGSAEGWTRSHTAWSIRTWLLPEDVYA